MSFATFEFISFLDFYVKKIKTTYNYEQMEYIV
jgi:hypothetical protein